MQDGDDALYDSAPLPRAKKFSRLKRLGTEIGCTQDILNSPHKETEAFLEQQAEARPFDSSSDPKPKQSQEAAGSLVGSPSEESDAGAASSKADTPRSPQPEEEHSRGSPAAGNGSPTGSAEPSYWDEEDAMQAVLRKTKHDRDSKTEPSGARTEDGDRQASGSEGSCTDSGAEGGPGSYKSESEGDEDDAQSDISLGDAPKGTKSRPAAQVNVDCIGFGHKPALIQMADVLAKVKSKAAAAIARASARPRVSLPSVTAPSPLPEPQQSCESSGLVIASDDDDEEEENSVPRVPLNFAIGSETQQEFPMFMAGRQAAPPEPAQVPDLPEGLEDSQPEGFKRQTTPQKTPFLEMGRRIQHEKEQKRQAECLNVRTPTPLKGTGAAVDAKQTPSARMHEQEGVPSSPVVTPNKRAAGNQKIQDATVLQPSEDPSVGEPTETGEMADPSSIARQAEEAMEPLHSHLDPSTHSEPHLDQMMQIGDTAHCLSPAVTSAEQHSRQQDANEQAGHGTELQKPPIAEASEPASENMAEVKTAVMQKGQQEDEAIQEDEELVSEDEASYQDSSSESDDEADEGNEGDSPEARAKAMAEARLMLKDQRSKKRRRDYLEDEAEMSEDEGHSDDGQNSQEDEDHDDLLEDLIGFEKEKKGDERRRAEAHAAWLEKQDEADVRRLMDGIQHGFRKRQGHDILGYEDGSLADARRRRAAVDAGGAGSYESASESSDSEQEEPEQEKRLDDAELELLSDGEEKENLQRYQNQKLLRDTQDAEGVLTELVDADSQVLLNSLTSAALHLKESGPAVKPLVKSVFAFSPHAVRKSTVTASFLGRSVGAVSNATRPGGQNTKSYIFGRDDSNCASGLDGDNADGKENVMAAPKGPTSFAGIKRSVLGGNKAGSLQAASLLDKLGPSVPQETKQDRSGPSMADRKYDVKELLARTSKPVKKHARTTR